MTQTINLLPKQTKAWNYIFYDDKIQEIGYGGAAGGGKSMLGAYMAIVLSETYPGAKGVIARKELKNLKQTTLVTLLRCLNQLGYKKDKDYKYNDKMSTLKFNNGSEIILMDMSESPSDPDYIRFGGLEITWAWVDESNEVPATAKEILKTRIGRCNTFDGKVVKRIWLETFNPNKSHVYYDFYKPHKERTLPEYRVFIPALPGDNPHLTKDYLDGLARGSKITVQRLLYGNFDYDDDPTTLMNQDAIYDIYSNSIVKTNEKCITADIARFGKDKTVIGIWEGLDLVKIETYEKLGVDEVAEKIKRLASDYKIPFSNIVVDADGVGGGVADILRGVKNFMGASMPIEIWNHMENKMQKANFKNLRHQCYFQLADTVNCHKLKISDNSFKDKICEELGSVKRKNEETEGRLEIISKDEIKKILGRSPDYADMLMMRMVFVLKKYPIGDNIHRTFGVQRWQNNYKNENI